MAQMANQDPESIMFNWSAPSKTAGGEGETTARRRRRRCASWTAPIADIWTPFFHFSFQLCRPWTSQTDCGRERDKTIIRDFIVILAAEDTRRSQVEGTLTRNAVFTYIHKQDHTKTYTFALADTSNMHAPHPPHTNTSLTCKETPICTLHVPHPCPVPAEPVVDVAWLGSEGQNETLMWDAMRDLETPRLWFNKNKKYTVITFITSAHTPDLSVLQKIRCLPVE